MLKKRIFAYLMDMMIIAIIMNIIGIFFISPNIKNLNFELDNVNTEFIDKKIDEETYMNRLVIIEHDLDKESINSNIIEVMLIFGYFVIVPFCFNGQTLGKKVFKIKIIAKNGELTLRNLLVRTLIIDGLGSSLILISIVYLISSMPYFIVKTVIQLIEVLIVILSIIKIKNPDKKVGIHDILAKTEVVEIN